MCRSRSFVDPVAVHRLDPVDCVAWYQSFLAIWILPAADQCRRNSRSPRCSDPNVRFKFARAAVYSSRFSFKTPSAADSMSVAVAVTSLTLPMVIDLSSPLPPTYTPQPLLSGDGRVYYSFTCVLYWLSVAEHKLYYIHLLHILHSIHHTDLVGIYRHRISFEILQPRRCSTISCIALSSISLCWPQPITAVVRHVLAVNQSASLLSARFSPAGAIH